MSKLPLLTARELIHILKLLGFECMRQKGSHMSFYTINGINFRKYKKDKSNINIKLLK
ncbi:MAG: type II toxin-antitoxin system HicA family toxin [Bacteroidia bacterium]|nr:type II toxin-antitoxin system HicA family toxin [Bacteroidia bacterium]